MSGSKELRINPPFSGHVLDLHARDSDLQTCYIGILDSGVLVLVLLHLLVHDIFCLFDDLVQEDDRSLMPYTRP